MRFSVYQESQIGGRKVNQDRMGYSFTRDALLLLLTDGLGGHLHGEIAASITMETIGALFQKAAHPYIKNPERFFIESLHAAHLAIHHYREVYNLSETPRTTVIACLIQHDGAFWAHCGDSRLYWMREGQILARTRDHSRIETLIAQGKVDPAERGTHPDRNKLFNCLGANSMPKVELSQRASLQAGDVMLLCSDGLWSMISDHELAQRLQNTPIRHAVPDLIRNAISIAGKSSDNVTALAMVWESTGGIEDQSTSIITHTLPIEAFTTTIQTSQHEAPETGEPFKDDEIEKAIEEIRDVIEKSMTEKSMTATAPLIASPIIKE